MKCKLFSRMIVCAALAIGLVLAGCDTGTNGGGGGGTTIPSVPTGVTATAQSPSSISVSWDSVPGATSYKVYYGIGSPSTKNLAGTVTSGTSYTHTGLQPSTTYYYYITAVNSAGESGYSDYGSAATSSSGGGGETVPSAPTGVTATAQSPSSISVSWDSVPGATSYKVYYGIGSPSMMNLAGTVTSGTSYTYTGLQPSTTYYCYITAVNSAGESDPSSYTSATTPSSGGGGETAPSAPTGVTATAQSSSSISVSWDSVSGATSYKVYYEIGSSSTTKNLAGTVTSGTSYTHTGLQSSTTYYYYITAVNSAGESDYSSYTSATTSSSGGGGTTVPSAPSGVTATAQSSSSIRIAWNTVSGATSYKVYYGIGSSSTKNLAGTVTSGTSYTHTGLQSSTTYYYYITAVNSAGESGYSSYTSATTSSSGGGETGTTPGAPTVSVSGSSTLTITWTTPSGSPTSYDVYRSNRITGQSELLRENITTRSYTDSSPYPGTNLYGVRAKNSYGTGSAGTGINSTPVPLATPTMGTISWGSGAESLSILINPVTHATEYIVYYSERASGTYTILGTVDSDTMLAGKINFTHYFPVERKSTWYFKVAAVFETEHTPSRVVSSQSSYKSYTLP